jgi:hypothetical protein
VKVILCFLGLLCWIIPYWNASGSDGKPPETAYSESVSGCIQCHTDVKKLIRLSWEVERVRGKPAVSAQTQGEG